MSKVLLLLKHVKSSPISGIEEIFLLKLLDKKIKQERKDVCIYMYAKIEYWHPFYKPFGVAVKANSSLKTRFTPRTLISEENVFRFHEVFFNSTIKTNYIDFKHSKAALNITNRPEHPVKLRDTFLPKIKNYLIGFYIVIFIHFKLGRNYF